MPSAIVGRTYLYFRQEHPTLLTSFHTSLAFHFHLQNSMERNEFNSQFLWQKKVSCCWSVKYEGAWMYQLIFFLCLFECVMPLTYVCWFGIVIDDDRVRMHFKASELTRGFRANLKTKRICTTSILAPVEFKYRLNLQTNDFSLRHIDPYDGEKNHWYQFDIASLSGG